MIKSILNRKEIEDAKGLSKDIKDAISINEYPVYYVIAEDGRNVLIFCNEELIGINETIEEFLNTTVYKDDYDFPVDAICQIFMSTQSVEQTETNKKEGK